MTINPSIEVQKVYASFLQLSELYGLKIKNTDGKLFTPRLIVVLLTGVIEQVLHFYGLYQVWPNTAYICNSLAIYCLIIQIIARTGSLIIRQDHLKTAKMGKQVTEYYKREEKNDSYKLILTESVKQMKILFSTYLVICFILFGSANPTAWIVSWYTGELTLPVHVFLPFTDPKVLVGYIINSLILVYYTFLLIVVFTSGDLDYTFFVYQCIPMIDIYCKKLKEFGEKVVKVKTNRNKTAVQQKQTLTSKNPENLNHKLKKAKEIAKVEQELITFIKEFNTYNNYLQTVVEHIEFTAFAAMTLNSLAIGMGIVSILYYSKAVGSVIVVFLTFQVLIPCILGTIVSHQKEKLLNELYGFPWYELTLSKQKIFLQFLHFVQNSTEFKILMVGQLNIELFTTVINGAYSYLMYLIKFLKL